MPIKMGVGTYLPREAIFKRRFRWTLEFDAQTYGGANLGKIQPCVCAIASRPNLNIQETEVPFLNETGYISSKPNWEPLQVTFNDFSAGSAGADKLIQNWLRAIYYYGNPTQSGAMGDGGKHYKRDGTLRMYDGVGNELETWFMYGCWLTTANFGDLDYGATENATIEATVRFDNAEQFVLGSSGGPAGPGSGTDVSAP